MIYFITGASSFIGVELCRYLTNCGHRVIAMSRKSNERLNEIASGGKLQTLIADMRTLTVQAQNVKADVFVHLAWAGTSHEERNDPAIQNGNVLLAVEYVKLARQMGCKLFVDAGSQAEYGIVQNVISETTPCNPATAYGKAKLKMYLDVSALTKQLKMKYIHLRIFSVYGEHDHENTLVISSLKKMMVGAPVTLNSGLQKWNYLYEKDAARQIAELTFNAYGNDNFRQEVYNIASDDTRRLQDFVITMKGICNSSSTLSFGGYNPEKDVNLNPDMTKTENVVKPLTQFRFEDVISKMIRHSYLEKVI